MTAIDTALRELAGAVGSGGTLSPMDDPETFLDAVDTFLGRLDPSKLGRPQMIWLQARCAYFVGEVIRRRHGGMWLLQEDPDEHFYMTPVVGGFEEHPSVTVSPPSIVRRVVGRAPAGSLRKAIEQLGLDAAEPEPEPERGMTGRHKQLVPKLQCTCGQALWDFAGGHGGKATWLSDQHGEKARNHLADLVGAWLASCQDGHREAFIQHVLGMDPNDTTITGRVIVGELLTRGFAEKARTAFECPKCGHIWFEEEEGRFVAYSPDTERRHIFEEPPEPASPDSVRMPIEE